MNSTITYPSLVSKPIQANYERIRNCSELGTLHSKFRIRDSMSRIISNSTGMPYTSKKILIRFQYEPTVLFRRGIN